jgi:hypothetical protein
MQYRLAIPLFVLTALAAGCKKTPTTLPAGDVDLNIRVHHHNVPIANAVVWRKNGTALFPGQDTLLYETRYVTDGQGRLTIHGLGNGLKELVVYATGIDPAWDSTQQTPVWGYQLLSIETKPGFDSLINVSIPVSE